MGSATKERTEPRVEDDGLSPEDELKQPPTPPANLPDDDPEPETDDKLRLPGFRELGITVAGREPESAVLKIKGQRVELDGGQFDRGDRFLTVDVLQVVANKDGDSINRLTGEIKSSSREQTATICSTTRIEHWLYKRLADAFPVEQVEEIFAALELDVNEARD